MRLISALRCGAASVSPTEMRDRVSKEGKTSELGAHLERKEASFFPDGLLWILVIVADTRARPSDVRPDRREAV